MVTDRRLDLGITLSPILSTQSHELAQQKIFEDEFIFVVSENHPWAKRGRANYADMPDPMLILYDEQISTHPEFGGILRALLREPSGAILSGGHPRDRGDGET